MAGVTDAGRILGLNAETWWRRRSGKGLVASFAVAVGAYAVLAFDRFGPQAFFEPRATVRFLLAGLYSCLWLAIGAWVVGRFLLRSDASFETVFRLLGYAHLPLLAAAVVIQVSSVLFRFTAPSLIVVLVVVVLWLPATLVAATRTAFSIATPVALLVVAGPYMLWLLVVGSSLLSQLGHLL